ncbi:hypothetical protein HDK90DRAFT_408006 [Phyllosticta capitalensis]|uniref:MYND-type domain-containing protein n=1 Tax=Phyllosticta capitalensis TaxID=121624 RepID=A0ABR1Z0F6_9PEZI
MSPLKPSCQVCGPQERLLRCSACKAVSYCGQEHQAADRPQHKKQCKEIKNNRLKLEREEAEMRAKPDDMFLPQPIFEKGVGNFWGILDTRDYMRARCGVVNSLVATNTFEGLSLAMEHTMDMLRLCRSDNLGMRTLVPAVLLRLGKEQECYDFIKWWEKISEDSHYDWGNNELPYLDIKDADVFEPVDLYCKKFADLYKTFDVMLLKIQLLLDLRSLQNSQEVFTTLVQNRKEELRAKGLQQLIETLESQIQQLYNALKRANANLWPVFINPEPHFAANPPYYSRGELSEAQLALKNSYQAWRETPGSTDVVRNLMVLDPDFPNVQST